VKKAKSKKSKQKSIQKPFFWLLLLAFYLFLGGCGNPNPTPTQTPQTQTEEQGTLIVNNAVLEQFKENGQQVWKVKAIKARYRKNKEIAEVEKPEGELYQDGKLVFIIQAKEGEVQQDGKKIFLKNDIIAIDIQSGAVLRGDELEWTPDQDLLIVRKNLNGTHKQLDAFAKEARMYSRKRQMELIGEVIAVTKEEPILHLRTERVLWEIDKELVIAPQFVLIDRYQDKKISDRAESKKAEVNLKTKIVTLKDNATVRLLDPTLEITSNAISWNVEAEMVNSSEPIEVNHTQEKIVFTGNSGKVDIKQEICYLVGNVQGYDTVKKTQLRADELTWLIKTQNIDAQGNIIYRQFDPEFAVSGPTATGSLKDKTVTVSGGGGPVVTEIIPEEKR